MDKDEKRLETVKPIKEGYYLNESEYKRWLKYTSGQFNKEYDLRVGNLKKRWLLEFVQLKITNKVSLFIRSLFRI